MTMNELRDFLFWSTAMNLGVLLLWFGVFVFAHDWMYRIHSRWFKIPIETFDAVHYLGISIYKIGILLFNFVPWIALYAII